MILPPAFATLAMDLADSDLAIPCECSVDGEIVSGITCIPSEVQVRQELDDDKFIVVTRTAISIPRASLPGVPKKGDRIWAGGKIRRIDSPPEMTGAGMLFFTDLVKVGFGEI